MRKIVAGSMLAGIGLLAFTAAPKDASADAFSFSNAAPDGLIGTLSRPPSAGAIQTETADDFILPQTTQITRATFYGLIPAGTPLSAITQVEIEFYHLFPADSGPFSGKVPTRMGSPADVEIGSATRDSADGSLSFSSSLVNSSFSVGNSVINGIHPSPGEFTGGEGPQTGQEVLVTVDFTDPVTLPADHYFFRPEALVSGGDFLALSAPKTMGPPDLQSWIRNDDLAPDWLRIGTDITHQGPFNLAFSLNGETVAAVPEPASAALFGMGLGLLGLLRSRRKGA